MKQNKLTPHTHSLKELYIKGELPGWYVRLIMKRYFFPDRMISKKLKEWDKEKTKPVIQRLP